MRSIKKNRAFLESYEPGSIVKPLALAGAIENNLIDIDTELELPIKIEVDGNIINDRKKYGQLKAFEIIKDRIGEIKADQDWKEKIADEWNKTAELEA